ncbi:MAG: fumarylacetoacetate hydrolase family protein [Bacteroidetes Order II. Incertae sedis bacterium]|nr:fumarylacetoacetate hydrolase family protein [Bacteroidetes Order II. bacterium]
MKINLPGFSESIRPGKLICIGRNYAEHAKEMQSAVPTEPMIFLKPATSLVGSGGQIIIPAQSQEVHHEVELVVALLKGGKNIPVGDAFAHVSGYAVGLDMTARDLQARAKKAGAPWSVAKGFDTFAPIGDFVAAHMVPDAQDLFISLKINGEVRQKGHTADMIFSVARLVAYASTIFTLEPGDLIYTGTPEGVGAIRKGDVLEAEITGLPTLYMTAE